MNLTLPGYFQITGHLAMTHCPPRIPVELTTMQASKGMTALTPGMVTTSFTVITGMVPALAMIQSGLVAEMTLFMAGTGWIPLPEKTAMI